VLGGDLDDPEPGDERAEDGEAGAEIERPGVGERAVGGKVGDDGGKGPGAGKGADLADGSRRALRPTAVGAP
jgi:hypothetical protein